MAWFACLLLLLSIFSISGCASESESSEQIISCSGQILTYPAQYSFQVQEKDGKRLVESMTLEESMPYSSFKTKANPEPSEKTIDKKAREVMIKNLAELLKVDEKQITVDLQKKNVVFTISYRTAQDVEALFGLDTGSDQVLEFDDLSTELEMLNFACD